MMNIKYDRLATIRSTRYFNDMEQGDKEMSLQYLGEELIENSEIIDRFLSNENGGFDCNNIKHARLFARIELLNEELENIIEKSGMDNVEIRLTNNG